MSIQQPPTVVAPPQSSEFSSSSQFLIDPISVHHFDSSGFDVNLKGILGEQAAVVIFYRGSWCPYCSFLGCS